MVKHFCSEMGLINILGLLQKVGIWWRKINTIFRLKNLAKINKLTKPKLLFMFQWVQKRQKINALLTQTISFCGQKHSEMQCGRWKTIINRAYGTWQPFGLFWLMNTKFLKICKSFNKHHSYAYWNREVVNSITSTYMLQPKQQLNSIQMFWKTPTSISQQNIQK